MFRFVEKPRDLNWTNYEILSGPRAIGASQTESATGFSQSVSSPFGAWKIRFDFAGMDERKFRAYRGWIAGMHGGANACRIRISDLSGPGMKLSDGNELPLLLNFKEGFSFSGGKRFKRGGMPVKLAAPAKKKDTIIELQQEWWEPNLEVGDAIGFTPFHFGWYIITQKFGGGRYRISFPLRKALTLKEYALPYGTLAMTLEGEESASVSKTSRFSSGQVTMIEIFQENVDRYFAR